MIRHLSWVMVVALAVMLGCGAPPAEEVVVPTETPEAPSCGTKDCFIAAANDCGAMELTLTEEAGTFTYSSSADCVFTKTMVTPDPAETQEMKSLLQGKSMTCRYEKGKFDERWVTSLLFGSEKCEGELKDTLARLLVFA
jgi:hypothetical protein